MLPFVAAISLWGIVWLLHLTLARGWRIEGSLPLIALGQTLFYAATAAIAALLVAVTRETATALSASAVYAGSALAYSGATLPLNGANAFAHIWSNVLPLNPTQSRRAARRGHHRTVVQSDGWLQGLCLSGRSGDHRSADAALRRRYLHGRTTPLRRMADECCRVLG